MPQLAMQCSIRSMVHATHHPPLPRSLVRASSLSCSRTDIISRVTLVQSHDGHAVFYG
jgi:hypothetical protein